MIRGLSGVVYIHLQICRFCRTRLPAPTSFCQFLIHCRILLRLQRCPRARRIWSCKCERLHCIIICGFPKIVYPINGRFFMDNPIKTDDLGEPFRKLPFEHIFWKHLLPDVCLYCVRSQEGPPGTCKSKSQSRCKGQGESQSKSWSKGNREDHLGGKAAVRSKRRSQGKCQSQSQSQDTKSQGASACELRWRISRTSDAVGRGSQFHSSAFPRHLGVLPT